MKQILLTLLCLLFAMQQAKADWSLSDDGVLTITSDYSYTREYYYPWYSKRDSIKSVVFTDAVTSIGDRAFYYSNAYTSLTSVTIPNSVESIGESAFRNCTSLTSITIPNSVTSIDWRTFTGCTSLTSITIPNSVTSIGNYAFSGCTGLTSVTIGNSVTSIDGSAFSGCTGLTSITIPNSVTSIVNNAFSGCAGLTSVTIGNSVESIGEDAFLDCTSLEEVKSEVVTPFIYSAFTNLTIYIPKGTKKAYMDNWGITNKYIEVPEADGGLVLDNVAPGTLAERVVLAGYKLNEVSKLTISGSLNADDWAIVNNSMNSLLSLDLSGLTSEFQGNEQISQETRSRYYELVLPDGIEKINDMAFQGFSNLTYITIPSSINSIGASAFSDCLNLRYLTIKDCPQSGFFELGGNISYVGNYAFSGCESLSKVTIGDRVKTIGKYAFQACTSLTSVSLGRSLESIPSKAFYNCSNLQEVTIGKSVKEIAYDAFYGTKVITITCYANAAPSVAQSFSSISPSSCKLYVPKTGLLSYATHQVWSQFDYEGIDGLSDAIVLWVDKHGSVSVNNEEYYYGEHIIETTAGEGYTLSFKAEAGYALNSVNVDGEDITDKLVNNTYEYTAEASDLVLAATFIDAANRAKLSFDANCGSVEILSVSADTMRLAITPKNEHVLVGIFVDGEKIFDGNKLKSASVGAQMNEDGTITISGLTENSVVEVRFVKTDVASKATLSFDKTQGKAEIVKTAEDVMTISVTPTEGNELGDIYIDGQKAAEPQVKANADGTISISGLTENSVVEVRFISLATPVVNIKANNEATIVGVYSLAGQLLSKSIDNLPQGVYIVVYFNGTSQKALVK